MKLCTDFQQTDSSSQHRSKNFHLGSKTPLIAAISSKNTEIVKVLVNNGADIHETTNAKWTMLMLVARRNKKETTQFLLTQSIDLSLKNNKGETALDIAMKHKHVEIIKLIKPAMTRK